MEMLYLPDLPIFSTLQQTAAAFRQYLTANYFLYIKIVVAKRFCGFVLFLKLKTRSR